MTAIATKLNKLDASIFLAQETNTKWTLSTLQQITTQCHKVYTHKKIATSCSDEKSKGTFQPGGTMTLALGKWASRVIHQGRDKILGQWSYLELVGQHGKRIILISAYCVCAQEFDPMTTTATAQQTRLLLQQGIQNPKPRQQFICDLISQLNAWRHNGKEIILGMDTNEDIDNPRSQIMRLFNEMDLIDFHHHHYPALRKPATHQRGSTPIDVIVGTPGIAQALKRAWILPFGLPPLSKGDHRLLGIDFDPEILFGTSPATLATAIIRGVNSKHELHTLKFCKETVADCNRHRIAERIASLTQKTHLQPADIDELKAIDECLTRILIAADRHCQPLSCTPWSLTVQKAYLCHQYWSIKLSVFRNQTEFKEALNALTARLDLEDTLEIPGRSLSTHLRLAQRKLKLARSEATKLQKAHLEEILNQAIAAKQHNKSQALKYLIRAERNRQCYAHFRHHTKPKSAGSLAYINITNKQGEIQPILDQDELEETLLEHSCTHFAQVEGSPFTTEPLGWLLQYNGLTPFGDWITQGRNLQATHTFDEPTSAILANLKRKLPAQTSTTHPLDYEKLLEGIKKWPERMTTSPSGRHLGIYKSLGKHVIKKNDTETTLDDPPPKIGITQGRDILYAIFDIMLLAVHHEYPLQRWRKVWTLFIEKELGNPHLKCLRCIMIFEADWQLLLKWHSSYGFLPKTEEAGTLTLAQGGGRKG